MNRDTLRVTFDDLCSVWPPASDRDRVTGLAAFAALKPDERRDAIAGAAATLQLRRRAGITHKLSMRVYLDGRCWVGLTPTALLDPVTFDDLCAVWPMRSEAERDDAEEAFEALPVDRRRVAVAGAEVLAEMHAGTGIERRPAAEAILQGLGGWAEFGRMCPEYRDLIRRSA